MADAVFVNDAVGSISREECVMTALHVGADGSPSALLRGQGRRFGDVEAILEVLEPSDQKFVNKLRARGRGLWSEVNALEKKYRGTAPKDADGSPFPPGSLWPGLGGGMLLGSGGSGASEGPLSLEGLKRDMERTVAVLSLRHAVQDARKLLHHPRLDAALHERLGPQAAADLDQWLQDAEADANGWTDVLDPGLMIVHTPGTPLVNVDKAVFDMRKLTDYSLDFNHPDGKDKARVWKSALGVEQKDADMIYRQVMEKLPNTPAVFEKKNAYGEYFNVFVPVTGPNGKTVDVLTAWIYHYQNGGDYIKIYPHLTTIFIPGESHD